MSRFLLGIAGTLFLAADARAHFLFVRILPHAEAGRAAEVYFSELAQAGDPRFIDKIAGTQLWLQTKPGEFEQLTHRKGDDRLRAHLPPAGSLMVVGSCEYGVLARPKQTPFLLRHFPKAVAGNLDDLSRLKPFGKLPLEITAVYESDGLRLSALKDGQPLKDAEFVVVNERLEEMKIRDEANGVALWRPKAGSYAIYTRLTRKQSGEAGGKKYEEIREFATLALDWPLARKDADSAAVTLFEEAIAARAEWRQFPGFEAKIAGNLAGRAFDGTMQIDADGSVNYSDNVPARQESVSPWVEDQLGSIVLHRLARPQSKDRPKPVLRFADAQADHPLGRLLIFDGGKFASSYRVKDKQILVVNRQMGKESMTITILENDRTKEGTFLPRSYLVQYWDAATGRLLRTESVQDRWTRVGAFDLPTRRTVTQASDQGLSVRAFTLTEHRLSQKP
jgi:hypothetical protein